MFRDILAFLYYLLTGRADGRTENKGSVSMPPTNLGVGLGANTAQEEILPITEGVIDPHVLPQEGIGREKRDFFSTLRILKYNPLGELIYSYLDCGHFGPVEFEISGWSGERRKLSTPEEFIFSDLIVRDIWCPLCYFNKLEKTAIRCSCCGAEILAGDGVTLYEVSSSRVNTFPEVNDDGMAIGCLREQCCKKATDRKGFWTFDGFESLP